MIIEQKLKGEYRFDMIVPIAETFKQNGTTNLRGVGSTTDQSLSRHKMEESAIADMNDQAAGLAGFLNHDPDQVFGQIVGVESAGADKYVPIFQLLTDHPNPGVVEARDKILHWIDNKMSIGLSIGGLITEAKLIIEEDENGDITNWYILIQHIKLLETSVTPIPAVWETKGTVRKQAACYGPLCHQMVHTAFKQELKQINFKSEDLNDPSAILSQFKLEQGAGTPKVNSTGFGNAKAAIKAGKINTGNWSAPEATKDNCIAYYPDEDPKNKAYYGFPVMKGGEVYSKGVGSALGYAKKNGYKDVANAAQTLSDMIKDKKNQSTGDNMDEEFKQMLKLLMKDREDRIAKEEAEEAARKEKERLDTFKQEVLDEVTEKVTESIKEDMLTKTDLQEFVAELRGDKKHVQSSKQGGKEPEIEEEEERDIKGTFTGKDIVGQAIKNPVGEFGHYGGKQVKQMTSLELVRKYAN